MEDFRKLLAAAAADSSHLTLAGLVESASDGEVAARTLAAAQHTAAERIVDVIQGTHGLAIAPAGFAASFDQPMLHGAIFSAIATAGVAILQSEPEIAKLPPDDFKTLVRVLTEVACREAMQARAEQEIADAVDHANRQAAA